MSDSISTEYVKGTRPRSIQIRQLVTGYFRSGLTRVEIINELCSLFDYSLIPADQIQASFDFLNRTPAIDEQDPLLKQEEYYRIFKIVHYELQCRQSGIAVWTNKVELYEQLSPRYAVVVEYTAGDYYGIALYDNFRGEKM
jgi:hypothetical protein